MILLSRFLAGELTPKEVEALERILQKDPDLQAEFLHLQTVLAEVSLLEPELPPPPLPDSVYGVRTQRSRPWIPVLLALAAVALLWVGWPSPSPTILAISYGETLVEGELSLFAPGATIELNGRARILVEPTAPKPRVAPYIPEENTMRTRDFLAGLAGAALTITVYEGTALVLADSGNTQIIEAGEHRTFSGKSPLRAATSTPQANDRQAGTASDLEHLRQELEATKKELAEERFAGALTRGQLQVGRGKPSEWPSDVPSALTERNFEASFQEQVAGLENLDVTSVDCSEYPCLATVRYTGTNDNTSEWHDSLMETLKPWFNTHLESVSISANRSAFRNDDQSQTFMTIAAYGGDENPEIEARLRWRMNQVVEGLGDEVRDGAFEPPEH